MATLRASTAYAGCSGTSGLIRLSFVQEDDAPDATDFFWTVVDANGTDHGGTFDPSMLPTSTLVGVDGAVEVQVVATGPGVRYASTVRTYSIACSGNTGGGTLALDSLSHTDETSARGDGSATIQAHGGTAPLTAYVTELGLSKPATSGQPVTFPGLAAGGPYTVGVRDSASPMAKVEGTVTIAAYVPPVTGCQDEYATNYDPAATQAGSCSYSVNWRSAWGPLGVAVRVAAVAGQVEAFVTATLRAGFRAGHPLAADRPLVDVATLRATVGPAGYATFVLAPYLRPLLGAPDGAGGYRYELNSATAYTNDLFVGYELRRPTGELLAHGYAVNAAVPDAQLADPLTPFAVLPVWPGFAHYDVAQRASVNASRYGAMELSEASDHNTVALPCPPNPLPVAWLAPGGGYGYWVFQGKHQLSDSIADGQRYQEALTGELRYSERGQSRRSYQARSGVFKGPGLAEGLATLWRSPQVWLKPTPDSDWVPVSIGNGEFPVRRVGVRRNEFTITFTEAAAQYAQGQ